MDGTKWAAVMRLFSNAFSIISGSFSPPCGRRKTEAPAIGHQNSSQIEASKEYDVLCKMMSESLNP
nr:hypothetical protein [Bacillus velezensis]